MKIKEGNFYKEKKGSTIIKVLKIFKMNASSWVLVKKNYRYMIDCNDHSCKYYKICLRDKSITCEYLFFIKTYYSPVSKIEVALKAPRLLEDSTKI